MRLTRVSDNQNVSRCNVVRPQDGDLVVVRMSDGEFALKDVQKPHRSYHLRLVGAKVRCLLFKMSKLPEKGRNVSGRFL